MKKYAHVKDGIVSQVIEIEDGSPSLKSRFHAAIVENCILLSGNDVFSVNPGFMYDGSKFYKRPEPIPQPNSNVRYVPVWLARQRLEAAGLWDDVSAIIFSQPSIALKVLTLESGIDVQDPLVLEILRMVGADPEVILAPQ